MIKTFFIILLIYKTQNSIIQYAFLTFRATAHLKDSVTASSYATNDGKDAAFTNVPPSTFRVMSIHDDGNGSSDSCSSTSGTLHAVNGFSDDFESKFDVALHQDTKGFILEPGRRAKVRIRFAPETVYNDFRQCKCELLRCNYGSNIYYISHLVMQQNS